MFDATFDIFLLLIDKGVLYLSLYFCVYFCAAFPNCSLPLSPWEVGFSLFVAPAAGGLDFLGCDLQPSANADGLLDVSMRCFLGAAVSAPPTWSAGPFF